MENYFEFYRLPVVFNIDAAAVRTKFLELSRLYHPDRYATADETTQADALKQSAMNNNAYNTLKDADKRMAYLLKLLGVLEEEEKYSLPPSFLMEMMDLNEALDEGNISVGKSTWEEALQAWETATNPLLFLFDSGERNEDLLKKIKDFYFQKKYLLRIKERLDTFAAS